MDQPPEETQGRPEEEVSEETQRPRRHPAFTWKSILLGTFGIYFQALHMMRSYPRVQGIEFDPAIYYSVFTIFYLVLLLFINVAVYRSSGGRFLTHQELAAVVMMNMVAVFGIGSVTRMGFATFISLPSMSHIEPATRSWLEAVSTFVFPQSDAVIEVLMTGGAVPWGAWAGPLLFWSLFHFAGFWILFCLAVMLRRRWTDIEAYQFPLAEPPMAMMEPADDGSPLGDFWRDPLVWLGIAVGAAYILVHEVPSIWPVYDPPPWWVTLAGEDWTGTWVVGTWSPLLVGLAYLIINLQILFSVWFFFLVWRIGLNTLYDVVGVADMGQFFIGYRMEQFLGAALAFAVISLWAARTELSELWQRVRGADGAYDDADEPVSYTTAFWGLIAGYVVVAGMAWAFLGVSLIYSILVLAIFTAVGLAFGRLRAQGGIFLNHAITDEARYHLVPYEFVGSGAFSLPSYLNSRYAYAVKGDGYTIHAVGVVLDCFKVGDRVNMHRRQAGMVVIWAGAATVFFSLVTGLSVIHNHGGLESVDRWIGGEFTYLYDLAMMVDPETAEGISPLTDPWVPIFMGIGVAMTALLSFLFTTYVWFPLHPIGFLAANLNWAVAFIWSGFFIAWVIKSAALRYGGTRVDQRLRMFFLGVIAGYAVLRGIYAALSYVVPIPAAWYF